MYVIASKSKNSESLYINKAIYKNGVRTSKIVEALGTVESLREKLGGADPHEWAKERAAELTRLDKNSKAIVKRKTGVLYYDLTNFFFELEQEDGLKQYGRSKENRPNPIVQMGLFMDADGIEAHFMTCFIALLIFRILEKKLGEEFTCHEIISGLRDMNFYHIPGEGYVPTYTRNDFTDKLHESFDFRADFEIISHGRLKKFFNS
jgi:hypothetical protein